MAIKELSKNKYKLDVPIGYNGNKRIRHIETFYGTKKEATLRENEIKLQLKSNTYINKNNITVAMFIEEWLKARKNNVAIKTYKNYEMYCKNISKYIGHIKLINVNAKILETFYNELKTNTNYSGRTIKDHYTFVTNLFNTAVNWNYLLVNPNLKTKPIKYTKTEIPCYSPEEVEQLLKVLKNEPIKYQAIIILTLDSGCRRGELTGLTWEDIDFDKSCININKTTQYVSGYGTFEKTTKTASSNRIVYISNVTLEILKKYRKEQLEKQMLLGNKWGNSKRVFTTEYGEAIHPNTPSKILDNIIKKYNLKKISFHGLRHTSISLLISSGTSIQIISKRAGHSNISITHNTYSHFFDNEFKEAANSMGTFLKVN